VIKVARIAITRAEGLPHECGVTHICGTWDDADAVLKRMAATAPDSGGYDKTDFRITWEDGETYLGRYDLTRADETGASLGRHVRDFCLFYSGRWRPEHLREAQYRAIVDRDPELRDAIARLLDTHQIGDAGLSGIG
jgi:hypothetical protein